MVSARDGWAVGSAGRLLHYTEAYTPHAVTTLDDPQPGGLVVDGSILSGYAIDLNSFGGTGVDLVHIYLDGPYGSGTILGAAQYGFERPDVGSYYHDPPFIPSGWRFVWHIGSTAFGRHELYIHAHRATDGQWSVVGPYPVVVRPNGVVFVPVVGHQR